MTRRLWALCGSCLALLLVLAPSAAAAPPPDSAVQEFGGCLATAPGVLLLVLDTSGSLKETDPRAERVAAARYLIEQLAGYVDRGKIKLEVAVAGFSADFEPGMTWTSLSGSSAPTVTAAIQSYATKNTGIETDYWNAVSGARNYLAQRATDKTCQGWVWFSDGQYDLVARNTPARRKALGDTKPYGPQVKLATDKAAGDVKAAGEADLCRAGGVADALRFQKVTTFAVGLGSNDTFDLMRRVSTGAGSCGAQPADRLGAFFLASNIDSLLLAFDSISDPGSPATQVNTPLCDAGAATSKCSYEFFLDDTISGVRMLGSAELDNFHLELTDPRGKKTDITRPAAQQSPTVSGKWLTPRTFELNLKKGSDAWTGRWVLVFVADGPSNNAIAKTNVRIYGDVRPLWVDQRQELTTGKPTEFTFGLENSAGQRLTDVLGSASLTVELRTEAGAVEVGKLDAKSLSKPLTVDLASVRPGPAVLAASLAVTTKGDPGTTLAPEVVQYQLTIHPPPNYPTLPATIDFGRTDVLQPVSRKVALNGPGCAWLVGSKAASVPDGVKRVDVASGATEASPATGSVPVRIAVDSLANGLIGGTATFATLPDGCKGEPVLVPVRYSYELERPLNSEVFAVVFFAVLAGGLLLPVGLLYLMKWRTAQIPGRSLAVASVSGLITDVTSFLTSTTLTHSDTKVVALEGADRRRVQLTDRVAVRTGVGLGLTEPGHVVAEPAPSVTSTGGAKLPLAVQDHWIAALDPVDPHRGPVEFVFVLSSSAAKLPELLADARNRGAELVTRLRSKVADSPGGAPPPPPPPPNDGWGGAPGSPSTPAPPPPSGNPW